MLLVHDYDRRHSPSPLRWEAASRTQEPKGWHAQHSLGVGPHCTPPPCRRARPPRTTARPRRALRRPALATGAAAFPACCRRRRRTFARRSVFFLVLLLGPAGDDPMSLLGRSMRPHSPSPTAPPPPEEVPASLASAPAATTSASTALASALGARGLKRPTISLTRRRSVSVRPALRTRSEAASSLSPLASNEDHNPQSPSPGLRGSAKPITGSPEVSWVGFRAFSARSMRW